MTVAPQPEPTGPYVPPLAPPRDEPFASGTLLAGRYRIVSLLGKGGMGEVYRADDLALGQPVALKFLPPPLAQDPDRLSRFRQEVALARKVSHPNVCRVYDIAEAEGRSFLTMEFVDGEDLASLLQRVGRLPEEKALEVARQLCFALAAVHEQNLLHRDLKPQNVMLDGRGKVRLADFGLAARSGDVADVRSGTPAYLAPEQRAGQEVTARSDLFSLGLVLYEVFTGKPAFPPGSSVETPSKPSSHLSGLNPAVERIILRCLERNPMDRPRSATEVLAALPGGDPLGAALAAGETPSPRMVADAGGQEGLAPQVAVSCFLGVLLLLVPVTLLAGRATILNRVPMPEFPEFLQRQAREVVRELGVERTRHSAWGFAVDQDYLNWIAKEEASSQRWDRLASPRPAAVYFWYRQSPRPLMPGRLFDDFGMFGKAGLVTPADPPPLLAGMIEVRLDTEGKLLALRRVPSSDPGSESAAEAPDWPRMFALAGLGLKQFQQRSLAGSQEPDSILWQERESERDSVRVAATVKNGKLQYFEVFPAKGPGDGSSFDRDLRASPAPEVGITVGWVWVGVLWTMGILFAVRNWRSGRADRVGAGRLFWIAFWMELGSFLLRASHMTAMQELFLLQFGVAVALLMGGMLWFYYLAAEPLMRRFWPQSLITWSRLLAGRVRDPLVGRDILIGTLAGILWTIPFLMMYVAPQWLDVPPPTPLVSFLPLPLGGHELAGTWLLAIPDSVEGGLLAWTLTFLTLRIVLRKQWLAATAWVVLFSVSYYVFTGSAVSVVCMALSSVVAVFLLVRYGLLAACVSYLVVDWLILPGTLTPNLSAWYAGQGLWTLGAVIALAAYGAHVSLGGRALLGKDWLGDE